MDEAGRFARIEALLDAALELPLSEREALLEKAGAGDPALADEVRALLVATEDSAGFLEAPAEQHPRIGESGWRLGAWRLTQPIGQGGMGEVWLAERDDGRYQQQAAVKLLRHWNPDNTPRFLREQRLLSRLRHVGIAQLLDAGSAPDGRPYMVMEYVAGSPLLEHCERHALDLDARLALFSRICDAVAHAHRHAIVHCDLKPSNILVCADGRVVLLDFGIARVIESGPNADAKTTSRFLTPRYAAPEQLVGGEESTQTDVYALGLILYELLAGALPWTGMDGRASLALLQRSLAGPPQAPSRACTDPLRARRLRGDLDAIVMKALRPEPEARYAAVTAFNEDLQRFRTRHPVVARDGAWMYRLRRGLQRNWLAAGSAMLVLIALLTGMVMVIQAQRETARERDIALTEAARSKAVRDYLAHMFREAGQHAAGGAPLTAKAVLEQAASRIESSFASDPDAQAEVLKALGELNFHIDDYAAAEPLLRRWLDNEARIADPVAAADVRFTLAETLHRMGRSSEAQGLLSAAQAFWAGDAARHADVLLTSRMLQSQLERAAGNVTQAIATLERALPQRLQRSGEIHFKTAALYNNLGAAYIEAGQLEAGIGALGKAHALWQALQLDTSNDALNTLNNLAAAQFRSGNLAEAESAFAKALQLRRTAFGESAATAALIGNYARVLQKRGKVAAALPLATEAETMAVTHAGARSALAVSIRLTRAELLLAARQRNLAADVVQAIKTESGELPPALMPRLRELEANLAKE